MLETMLRKNELTAIRFEWKVPAKVNGNIPSRDHINVKEALFKDFAATEV
jgi:hypothetical protein